MLNIARVISLMAVLLVAVPLSTYASVDTKSAEGANAGDDHLVNYRHAEATNPRCGGSDELAIIGGAGIGAAMAAGLTGVIVFNTHLPGSRFVGTLLMVGSITTIAAGVAASAPYFACHWSFVRHPVLRFESGEKEYKTNPDHKEKNYKECTDPKGGATSIVDKYKNGTCNKEFVNMADYYACISPGTSLEEASKNEPMCPERKFKQASEYAWPKNRVSSSRQIEVCYRHPLNTLVTSPFALFAMHFADKSYTELLKEGKYPRESTFGDVDMHKAKLAVSGAWSSNDNAVDCIVLEAGQEGTIYDVTYRAVERGSRLCVDAVKLSGMRLAGQPEIGCQLRPNSAPVPMCAQSVPNKETTKEGIEVIKSYDNSACYSCYVAETCKGVANLHSKSVFPVTAVIVGCIVDSLKNLLEPPQGCSNRVNSVRSVNPGFLKVAQEKLKKGVMAALILALILFSIKAVLGGVQNASELYMTVIKFALVIYFTQGSAMSHAYDQLTKLSIGLSDIVLQAAGSSNGVCDFKASDYAPGYVYLMPWDRLDCRVMFYLGSQLTMGTGTGIVLTMLLSAGLLIAAILINAKVIICLVAFFAVLMLIFTVIWTVYVFLLSLIALTVLTIISPLMIPMCLFQATKGFFDGWTRQLMTYSLYPVILFAFMSLMFTVFDNLYFGKLEFKRGDSTAVKVQGSSSSKIWFELKDRKACEKPENESNLACMFDSVRFHTKPLFLGISVSSPEFKAATAEMWTKLGVFVLIGFLFYHFLSSISYIAGELAGDPRAGAIGSGGMNPRSMARGAMGAAASMRSFASGKAADLGNRLRSGMSGGDKGADGTDKVSGGSVRAKGAKDSGG
ncbi:type IV secretion system protein [Candidatus Anaplasma sp. TIGMIC]|uniref:type IV secretion system protein n=1 Tax=Candidatus Anaplasma sp. TIGMIC TaxID=3020713 RepID=UPI00232E52A4|nr:type IV secretion system protein [Candidatus Anaplasma sp. TIGMIC]MDB1134995.1 type IV secretion system protein [Candidatus Anaplasma sp. TIGMIC]